VQDELLEGDRQACPPPDGSLLVGDDTNGVIYRVAYGPA
jgi:hypothetical protein